MTNQLSVIIPTFRRTSSIKRLIGLLNAQTVFENLEIIIVDQNANGYLTESLGHDVLRSVKHIYQKEPNVSEARNRGAIEASHSFLLFLDDDVLPEVDFCEKGLQALMLNKEIDVLSPVILRNGEVAGKVIPAKVKRPLYRLSIHEKHQHASYFTISAATFYKKEAFMSGGGFDPLLFRFAGTAEDQEFFIRLINKGLNVYVTTQIQIFIDESVGGGCDLRTADYWITRMKCMKAWTYRCRINHGDQYNLSFADLIELSRSAFLNSAILTTTPLQTFRQIRTLRHAIHESQSYVLDLKSKGCLSKDLNYLD